MFLICSRLVFKVIYVFRAAARQPVRNENELPASQQRAAADAGPAKKPPPSRAQTSARWPRLRRAPLPET